MKTIGTLLSYILGLTALIMFAIGLMTHDVAVLSVSAFCAWSMAMLKALSVKERNVIYVFFLSTFFIFLLSRVMVRWLRFGEVYKPFSIDIMTTIYSCIVVSIFGLAVGEGLSKYNFTFLRSKTDNSIRSDIDLYANRINIGVIRQIAALGTIICGFATLLVVLERIAFWRITGYGGDLRTSFSSNLPGIVLRLSYVYILLFCIYLSTFPLKRKCIPIFVQYLVVNALKMFYGSRVDFVVGLMFALVYFRIRDKSNEINGEFDNKWIGKVEKLFAIISIPALIVLMVFIGNYRIHSNFEFNSFFETLGDFFEAQGTSINVIGYTEAYRDEFQQPKFLYLFDNTYTFLMTNPVSSIVTGMHSYSTNTIERAIYGTSLDQSLYYMINQASYLAGNGCGSSYIAEAYLGYGYLGLFIVSVILSRIMNRLDRYTYNNLWKNTLAMIYLQSLFFTPRSGFDEFVGDFASVTHIFALALMWVIYKIIIRQSRKLILW